MTVAKGITSGYVPLGATIVSDRVARGLEDRYLGAGLTYAAHPLACAAGCAVLEVYLEERLDERAARVGERLLAGLRALAARHPVVGDVRGKGLLACLELVRNRDTREPLSPQRTEAPVTAPMAALRRVLNDRKVSTLTRWNLVVMAPPLTIGENEIDLALEGFDAALEAAEAEVGALA
jgi:taurine--2-oxoglutarate transaminase